MRISHLSHGLILACAVLVVAVLRVGTSFAQTDAELQALHEQMSQLFDAGKAREAVPLAKRYAEAVQARHGPDHPLYAVALNNLALMWQQGLGEHVEPERLHRQALAILEKLGDDNYDPLVANILGNLAEIARATDRLVEADGAMRRALAIDERSMSKGRPHSLALRLNNLGALLAETDRFAEGETLLRRAYEIDKQQFGPDHVDVARDLNNLARLFQFTNRPSEAEAEFRRVIAILKKKFTEGHPWLADTQNNLAVLLQYNKSTDLQANKRRLAEAKISLPRCVGYR